MNIEDLIKKDPSFSLNKFIDMAKHVYINLQSSVMIGNLTSIKNTISDKIIQKYQQIIDEFNNCNLCQKYDEISITKADLLSINNKDNKYYIIILIVSSSKDYVVDKKNQEYRYGINNQLVTKNNYLTFIKDYNNKDSSWLLDDMYSN